MMADDWWNEPSVEELLRDMMMPALFEHDRITADDVRALMRDVAARRARATVGDPAVESDRSADQSEDGAR